MDILYDTATGKVIEHRPDLEAFWRANGNSVEAYRTMIRKGVAARVQIEPTARERVLLDNGWAAIDAGKIVRAARAPWDAEIAEARQAGTPEDLMGKIFGALLDAGKRQRISDLIGGM